MPEILYRRGGPQSLPCSFLCLARDLASRVLPLAAVLTPDLRRVFDAVDLCFLATCEDRVPNVVAVGFKRVWEGKLLLVDLFFHKTRQNLDANPNVAVSIGWLEPKAGVQFKGTATVHHDGPAFDEAVRILRDAGSDATPHAAVVVQVEEAFRLDPGAGEQIL